MDKLNELVELANKATPGDWIAEWYDDERGYVTWYIDLERQRSAFFLSGDGSIELNGTGKPSDFDKADCNFIAAASPENILAIAEAFRELEQRAEAAEAKLAELAKQVYPKAVVRHYSGFKYPVIKINSLEVVIAGEREDAEELAEYVNSMRPAPAPVPVDLVPKAIPKDVYKVIYDECGGFVDTVANAQNIWDACLAAILRNIEEEK